MVGAGTLYASDIDRSPKAVIENPSSLLVVLVNESSRVLETRDDVMTRRAIAASFDERPSSGCVFV